MHLKKVVLKNFRCFAEFELNLHPRLTVLVAENGGGKTAVLDGIAIGLSPVLRYFSTANQRLAGPGIKDTDFRLELWDGHGGEERWGVSDYAQAVIETTSGLQWDNWRASAPGKQPVSKVGQSDLALYASRILESSKTATPELLPVFAYYGARRGWIVIPERLHESKVDYAHPTSALEGSLESLSDFKEMLKWFDLEEANELRANKGKSAGEYDVSPALSAVRSAIRTILGGAYENPRFNNKHKFVIESKIDPSIVHSTQSRQGGQLPFFMESALESKHLSAELQVSQLSQGYQSMLALGMDFARRLALANSHLYQAGDCFDWTFATDYIARWHPDGLPDVPPPGPAWSPAIMLVDEIDLHLHPSWQQRVLADLMRTFPATQFIVTTHSPQVLTTLRKENIRILACDEDGVWTAREPAISPLARESGDALAYIMDTHPRPEIPAILSDLHAYEQLARAGSADSEQACQIKARLDVAGFEYSDAEQALFDFLAHKATQSAAGNP